MLEGLWAFHFPRAWDRGEKLGEADIEGCARIGDI
jgi:hypothetical protein